MAKSKKFKDADLNEMIREVNEAMTEYMANAPEGSQAAKVRHRQEANLKILELLKEEVLRQRDVRFTQLLINLEIDTMRFSEESVDTLSNAESKRRRSK